MVCAINHIGHVIRCFDGEWVLGEACSRGDIARHFPGNLKLPVGPFSKQRYNQVFQRNHANPKVNQFGVRQFGDVSLCVAWIRTAFVVPYGKSLLGLPKLCFRRA